MIKNDYPCFEWLVEQKFKLLKFFFWMTTVSLASFVFDQLSSQRVVGVLKARKITKACLMFVVVSF